jgi:hypothetical protein
MTVHCTAYAYSYLPTTLNYNNFTVTVTAHSDIHHFVNFHCHLHPRLYIINKLISLLRTSSRHIPKPKLNASAR